MPTPDPKCCPACAALAAWDRAVSFWRAAQDNRADILAADDAVATAYDWQSAARRADYGTPIDPLRIETPFSVAYGY